MVTMLLLAAVVTGTPTMVMVMVTMMMVMVAASVQAMQICVTRIRPVHLTRCVAVAALVSDSLRQMYDN